MLNSGTTAEDRADLAAMTRSVERYVTFIGYPRSGHSLVGSLLDAHPNIIIAHEADALRFVDEGWERLRIWAAILQNSEDYSQKERTSGQFKYAVPGQWNGRFRDLRVIGDKKGGRSTIRLAAKPELLEALQKVMDVRCQFIHVIRNPFDNISTIAQRDAITLQDATAYYFDLCQTVLDVRAKIAPENWFDVRHESLIRDAAAVVTDLCRFLEQSCEDDYLRDCAGIVYDSAHQSRREAPWTAPLITHVLTEISRYPHLYGYSFDE